MTVTPFLVFMFGFWAARAREEQATGKWDKRLWVVVELALIVAAILAFFGHGHFAR